MRLSATLVRGIRLLAPTVAFAVCTGSDLRDTLPPEMVAQAYARVAQMPFHEGLVFEAMRGNTRVTLFGMVHVSDPAVFILDGIADRIRAADLVLVEMAAAEQELFQLKVLDNPTLMFDFATSRAPVCVPGFRKPHWVTLSGHLRIPAPLVRDRAVGDPVL